MSAENSSGEATISGAEAVVHLLEAHGVDTMFGLCGDTTLPLYDALQRLPHGIDHILTRDERSAAYMADAYARVTGKVGVCEGPSGGGATYILPGVIEANDSSIPVLAINSDVSVNSRGRYPLTELDQEGLFRPLTKWNGVVVKSEMLPGMLRAAFRAMSSGRPGAAHLGLPFDVQKGDVPMNDIWAQAELGRFPAWPAGPDETAVDAFVETLLAAKNPLLICGGGVVIAGGEGELDILASRLDLPAATTVSGQGSLGDSHPNCLGVVGSNGGTAQTRALVDAADLICFIGCRAGSVTTERWRSPRPGAVKILHIDSDPMVISAAYATDAALVADARLALRAINARLDRAGELPSFGAAARIAPAKAAKFAAFEALAEGSGSPIEPELVVREMNRLLPDDALLVADPGTPCPYFSGYYRCPLPGRYFISNRAHGALGYSLSAAVGAQIGRPDSKVVSVMGDGSFGFTCGELETVVRLGLPITFVVFSNSSFGWIKAGQKSGFGGRYFGVDFSPGDHAAVAAAFGVKSWRVEQPGELGAALQQAIAHPGPTLIDVISRPLQDAHAPVSEWVA